MVEQRLEVLEVQQQQAFAICHLECRVERRLLAVRQLQQAAEQQRAHFADSGAQGMTRLAMNVPQRDRIRFARVMKKGHAGDAFGHLALRVRRSAQATEVTLYIGGKYRHARITERLGQALQRDGLARAGGASNQPVAVGQAHGLGDGLVVGTGTNKELRGIRHFVTYG